MKAPTVMTDCIVHSLLRATWRCALVLMCAGCSAGGERHEWSLLQVVEYEQRDAVSTGRITVSMREGYCIVGLLAADGQSRVWVLMNPRYPPFLKQVPDVEVSMTPSDVAFLPVTCRPHPEVHRALVRGAPTSDVGRSGTREGTGDDEV